MGRDALDTFASAAARDSKYRSWLHHSFATTKNV